MVYVKEGGSLQTYCIWRWERNEHKAEKLSKRNRNVMSVFKRKMKFNYASYWEVAGIFYFIFLILKMVFANALPSHLTIAYTSIWLIDRYFCWIFLCARSNMNTIVWNYGIFVGVRFVSGHLNLFTVIVLFPFSITDTKTHRRFNDVWCSFLVHNDGTVRELSEGLQITRLVSKCTVYTLYMACGTVRQNRMVAQQKLSHVYNWLTL